jgi:hypothetical protein
MSSDFFFTYKNVLRYILMNKLDFLYSCFNLPFLEKIILYFFFNKSLSLDYSSFFNYAYLFRFFFGKKAFFTKVNSVYSFSKSFHSFSIQAFFEGKRLFSSIYFLTNDIFPFVTKSNLRKHYINGFNYLFLVLLFDLNIFPEKKTNSGLFDLRDSLGFKFFVRCSDIEASSILLTLLKIR